LLLGAQQLFDAEALEGTGTCVRGVEMMMDGDARDAAAVTALW
jgi:hypothetical protein